MHTTIQHMHVNQSSIKQVVFKVAAFCLDASAKTSLPLHDCLVNHTLVKLIPCRYNALTQFVNVIDATLIHLFLHHRPDFIVYRI